MCIVQYLRKGRILEKFIGNGKILFRGIFQLWLNYSVILEGDVLMYTVLHVYRTSKGTKLVDFLLSN